MRFSQSKLISIVYHNYFDYPLTNSELNKWQTHPSFKISKSFHIKINNSRDLYYLKNRKKLVALRAKRKKISSQKFQIAQRATKFLSLIPTIKFVGLTGSLAMNNCSESSDIDLMIIVKRSTLWFTRAFTLLFLKFMQIPIRRRGNPDERDKLCFNMWLDESDLFISDHNLYTAHELAQVVPVLNRGETYERLLLQNYWIKNYWPHAVKLPRKKHTTNNPQNTFLSILITPVELISFKIQWQYMKKSITNETISSTRAFFHPTNWSKKLESYLKKSKVSLRTQ